MVFNFSGGRPSLVIITAENKNQYNVSRKGRPLKKLNTRNNIKIF